jgi:hypothetical protein
MTASFTKRDKTNNAILRILNYFWKETTGGIEGISLISIGPAKSLSFTEITSVCFENVDLKRNFSKLYKTLHCNLKNTTDVYQPGLENQN